MDRELRIGVIGVGQRAVIARLANVPGTARVVACADPGARGQADAPTLFGPDVRVHADHRDLLAEDLDAVFVCTPDHRHAAVTRDALAAGVAVFVEKPLAITIEDCDDLLRAAKANRARLYVGHNLRHLPMLRRMKALIDEGAIGAVKSVWCRHFVGAGGDFYFKDWHAERANTTGLLLQKAAHDLDVIHWLAGGYTRSVVATGDLVVYDRNPRRAAAGELDDKRMPEWLDESVWPPAALTGLNPVIDVEDLSCLLGRLDNGVLTSYQQCHFTPDYWRNYTVIGDEGRLENFGDTGDAVIQVWNKRRSGYRAEGDLTVEVPQQGMHGGADGPLVAEFLRFVASGAPTETSPVAAREAVATGVAATRSLRTGSVPVTIPDLAADLRDYFAAHQPGATAHQPGATERQRGSS